MVAPGPMTEKMIREINEHQVRYLLWSNRVFPEYGAPIFGKDFNQEIGDFLKANFHPVSPLVRPGAYWEWTATVWERNSPDQTH
jgi:hypothetical protein